MALNPIYRIFAVGNCLSHLTVSVRSLLRGCWQPFPCTSLFTVQFDSVWSIYRKQETVSQMFKSRSATSLGKNKSTLYFHILKLGRIPFNLHLMQQMVKRHSVPVIRWQLCQPLFQWHAVQFIFTNGNLRSEQKLQHSTVLILSWYSINWHISGPGFYKISYILRITCTLLNWPRRVCLYFSTNLKAETAQRGNWLSFNVQHLFVLSCIAL